MDNPEDTLIKSSPHSPEHFQSFDGHVPATQDDQFGFDSQIPDSQLIQLVKDDSQLTHVSSTPPVSQQTGDARAQRSLYPQTLGGSRRFTAHGDSSEDPVSNHDFSFAAGPTAKPGQFSGAIKAPLPFSTAEASRRPLMDSGGFETRSFPCLNEQNALSTESSTSALHQNPSKHKQSLINKTLPRSASLTDTPGLSAEGQAATRDGASRSSKGHTRSPFFKSSNLSGHSAGSPRSPVEGTPRASRMNTDQRGVHLSPGTDVPTTLTTMQEFAAQSNPQSSRRSLSKDPNTLTRIPEGATAEHQQVTTVGAANTARSRLRSQSTLDSQPEEVNPETLPDGLPPSEDSFPSRTETSGVEKHLSHENTAPCAKATAIAASAQSAHSATIVNRPVDYAGAIGDLSSPVKLDRSRRRRRGGSQARSVSSRIGSDDRLNNEPQARCSSRASNVSRRRSTAARHHHDAKHKEHRVKKSRSKNVDRKDMMEKVAEQWNQWIYRADEEREDIMHELEYLAQEKAEQEKVIKSAKRELDTKNAHVKQLDDKCQGLQDSYEKQLRETERLRSQLEELKTNVEICDERSSNVQQKVKATRGKINEAITEQQGLWTRGKTFWAQIRQEMDEDRDVHAAESNELREIIDKAQGRQRKSQEALSYIRTELENKVSHQQQIIANLRDHIQEQGLNVGRVDQLHSFLKTQVKAQHDTRLELARLASSVNAFKQDDERRGEDHAMWSLTIDEVCQRLSERMSVFEQQQQDLATEKAQFRGMVEDARDAILSSVSKATECIYHKQSSMEQAFLSGESRLRKSFRKAQAILEARFTDIVKSKEVQSGIEALVEERCDQLSSELRQLQGTTNDIGQRLESMVTEGEAQAKCTQERLRTVSRELENRNTRVEELETTFQLETEDYAAKLRDLRANGSLNDKEVEQRVTEINATHDLQLHEELDKARAIWAERLHDSESSLQKAQASANTWKNQLEETQEKFAVLESSAQGHGVGLHKDLHAQKSLVRQLQERLAAHGEAFQATEQLHIKWRRDISAIDDMRAQIKALSDRLPNASACAGDLESAFQASDIADTTSSFLSRGQAWVTAQLRAIMGTEHNRVENSLVINVDDSPLQAQDSRKIDGTARDTTPTPAERGRVTIRSPGDSIDGRASPPTVFQEQERRRQGHQTHSILRINLPFANKTKSNATGKSLDCSQGLRGGPTETWDVVNSSRYFRGKSSSDLTSSRSVVKKDRAVKDIRSHLLPDNKAGSLMTFKEYIASSQESTTFTTTGKRPADLQALQSAPKRAKTAGASE